MVRPIIEPTLIMKDIEAVVFDIGGVLVDLDFEHCVATFEALGFAGARDMVSCYHPAGFFGELERGEITRGEFCDRIREAAAMEELSDEEICEAYCSLLLRIPVEKLRLIESLRARGFKTYALSNMSEVMIHRVRELMEVDSHSWDFYFDKMFISYEMGIMKPSPEIYDRMIAEIGVAAEKIFFIDDGVKNIEGAQRKGIKTYLAAQKEDFSHIFEEK